LGELRNLWIPGPAGRLEAALRVACPARAISVVAHPHPEQGGTLHNPVVFHSERHLHRSGLTSLRFNFRGVGTSEGNHDDGRGEVDDLAAAVSWLQGMARDLPLLLVGYSFGSWCSIRHAVANNRVAGVIAIGLPVRKYEFEELSQLCCPLSVIQGSEDEFGSPAEVEKALGVVTQATSVRVIPGARHLFRGVAPAVAEAVGAAADAILPRAADAANADAHETARGG
jgi:alpha/beta superfamily hydrolase